MNITNGHIQMHVYDNVENATIYKNFIYFHLSAHTRLCRFNTRHVIKSIATVKSAYEVSKCEE